MEPLNNFRVNLCYGWVFYECGYNVWTFSLQKYAESNNFQPTLSNDKIAKPQSGQKGYMIWKHNENVIFSQFNIELKQSLKLFHRLNFWYNWSLSIPRDIYWWSFLKS